MLQISKTTKFYTAFNGDEVESRKLYDGISDKESCLLSSAYTLN